MADKGDFYPVYFFRCPGECGHYMDHGGYRRRPDDLAEHFCQRRLSQSSKIMKNRRNRAWIRYFIRNNLALMILKEYGK